MFAFLTLRPLSRKNTQVLGEQVDTNPNPVTGTLNQTQMCLTEASPVQQEACLACHGFIRKMVTSEI